MRNRENEVLHKGRTAYVFAGNDVRKEKVQNVTKAIVTLFAYPSPFAKTDGRYLTENVLMKNTYKLAVNKEQIDRAKSVLKEKQGATL